MITNLFLKNVPDLADYEQVTLAGAAVWTPSVSSKHRPSGKPAMTYLLIIVKSGSIGWRANGTTANGSEAVFAAGSVIEFGGLGNVERLSICAISSAVFDVHYGS